MRIAGVSLHMVENRCAMSGRWGNILTSKKKRYVGYCWLQKEKKDGMQ